MTDDELRIRAYGALNPKASIICFVFDHGDQHVGGKTQGYLTGYWTETTGAFMIHNPGWLYRLLPPGMRPKDVPLPSREEIQQLHAANIAKYPQLWTHLLGSLPP